MNWERKYKSLKERWLSSANRPAESQVSMSVCVCVSASGYKGGYCKARDGNR